MQVLWNLVCHNTRGARCLNMLDSPTSAIDFKVEVSSEGPPIVLQRANKKSNNNGGLPQQEETRPYHNPALYVKEKARRAQLCLNYCIRGGTSARSAKMRPHKWLQPTLSLLQYMRIADEVMWAKFRRWTQVSYLLFGWPGDYLIDTEDNMQLIWGLSHWH